MIRTETECTETITYNMSPTFSPRHSRPKQNDCKQENNASGNIGLRDSLLLYPGIKLKTESDRSNTIAEYLKTNESDSCKTISDVTRRLFNAKSQTISVSVESELKECELANYINIAGYDNEYDKKIEEDQQFESDGDTKDDAAVTDGNNVDKEEDVVDNDTVDIGKEVEDCMEVDEDREIEDSNEVGTEVEDYIEVDEDGEIEDCNKAGKDEELEESCEVTNSDEEINATISSITTATRNSCVKYTKPARPCIFCKKMKTNLRRHIVTSHKNEEDVKALLLLPKPEQDREFDLLRKKGIFEENKQIIVKNTGDKKVELIRERRQGHGKLKMCSKCLGFFKDSTMWHHKLKCEAITETGASDSVTINQLLNPGGQDEFSKNILSRFHIDGVGTLCRNDKMIKTVGKILWERSGKKDSRATMGEMRKLGLLLECCRKSAEKNANLSGHDLLDPVNFRTVVDGLNELCKKDDDSVKASLKLSLGYLLKKAARFTRSEFVIDCKDNEVRKRDNFLSLLDSSWGYLFHDAQCQLESNREMNLRRPQNLPLEDDVALLRDYVEGQIEKIVNDAYLPMCNETFIELRSLLVCRLTLYNGRRGGEPARLLLKEWIDAETDAWVSQNLVDCIKDPVEKLLIGKFKLAYQRGKGARKMVPILVPLGMVKAMSSFVKMRSSCDVLPDNPYLFASIKSTDGHAVGWQAVNSISIKAGVSNPSLLTATRMRHRASTIYALQDVNEQERHAFYKHLGHSKDINESVYQCPTSVMEICKVGRFLEYLDNGVSASQGNVT